MTDMSDLTNAENLMKGYQRSAPLWSSAPKAVLDKADQADKARAAHVEATVRVQDAEVEIPAAQAQWEADSRAAVRAGLPLPSRDPMDRARIELEIAQGDERLAARKLHDATYYLAEVLTDPEIRDQWRTAADARLDGLRTELVRITSEAVPLVQETKQLVALSFLLGDWPQRKNLYLDGRVPDPITALREVAALKEWTPTVAGEVRTIHA